MSLLVEVVDGIHYKIVQDDLCIDIGVKSGRKGFFRHGGFLFMESYTNFGCLSVTLKERFPATEGSPMSQSGMFNCTAPHLVQCKCRYAPA